ncbi:MAG: acetyl-CoA carboxylase biotin carboxylase subunit [Bacteroidetes bacterium]|nr:acetyl-CoA carboxylase biotin carboxylase subunit [Bacteroidota bacterium]
MSKLLIANRGEIAVRIIRTARRMGIHTVAIYSEADSDSLHVTAADEAFCIGHSALAETYLNIEKVISIALETGCVAVHPGYGFLAENPAFVASCHKAGLIFVGPDTRAMQIMGNKIEARKFVDSIGVPVTKGLTGNTEFILKHVDEVGFPVLVKAAAGGGGKGMRIVNAHKELKEALEATSREAANYFADGTVYIEKFVENPRHIEIQLLGDSKGNVIHLFERECSIQRRYQKIIEEAPSPTLTPEVRRKMGEAAVAIGKAIYYGSAGTIEFLVDRNLDFYFLEMNTRIQVEHPVTEMTTGIDIVEEQLRIASGEELRYSQNDIKQTGHAIECRIYAEDPENNFMPSPGRMNLYHEPEGKFVRVDSGITGKPVIQSFFDPMISKLIVWGPDRESARKEMIETLKNYVVHGIKNNISYLLAILNHNVFVQNNLSTKYCDEHSEYLMKTMLQVRVGIDPKIPVLSALMSSVGVGNKKEANTWSNIGYWRTHMAPKFLIGNSRFDLHLIEYNSHYAMVNWDGEHILVKYHIHPDGWMELQVNDNHYHLWISSSEQGKSSITFEGQSIEVTRLDILPQQQEFSASEISVNADMGNIVSPMPGKVIKIAVEEGQPVVKGDLLLVVEAMKMENNIMSPGDGIVDSIGVSLGDLVDGSTRLIHLSAVGEK